MSINPEILRVELLDENDDDYKIYHNKKVMIPENILKNVKNNLKVHYEKFLNNKLN
jgi:hypothetical protein